jgi:MYXO-CTERM domain-containing protein
VPKQTRSNAAWLIALAGIAWGVRRRRNGEPRQ